MVLGSPLRQFAVQQITRQLTDLKKKLEVERHRLESANRALEEQTEALSWLVVLLGWWVTVAVVGGGAGIVLVMILSLRFV